MHTIVTPKHRKCSNLREIFTSFLNSPLDPQQQCRLPLVQLAHLIILEQLISEDFLVAILNRRCQVTQKLVLPLLAEAGIQLPVPVESGVNTDLVAGAQLADTGLEQVLLDGPAHEVVRYRSLGNLLVERDGLVVVLAFQRDEVGCLQPELVGECLWILIRICQKRKDYVCRVPLRYPV